MININAFSILDVIDNDMIQSAIDSYHLDILNKLRIERSYSSIPAKTLEDAQLLLKSIIEHSYDKYVHIIKLYDDELDNILSLDRVDTRSITTDKEQSQTDDAFTDDSLIKRNDTPNAGDNPDLITDKYLSESERVKHDISERSRSTLESGESLETNTHIDNIERFKLLGELEHNIANIYDQWLRYIDRNILIFNLHE